MAYQLTEEEKAEMTARFEKSKARREFFHELYEKDEEKEKETTEEIAKKLIEAGVTASDLQQCIAFLNVSPTVDAMRTGRATPSAAPFDFRLPIGEAT
jgi:hypothetical protein